MLLTNWTKRILLLERFNTAFTFNVNGKSDRMTLFFSAIFSRLPIALCRSYMKVTCFAFVVCVRFSSPILSQSKS